MENFVPHTKPSFDENEAMACYKYMMSGGYVSEYKYTRQLESMISELTGAKHCIMVNNGTISLSLALLACELKPGDEVIIPNITMVASINAAKLIGCVPVMIDVEQETLTLDISKLEKLISPRTKAIMHVSLNGKCNKLQELRDYCDKNNLYLIEDAAQSLGSFYMNRHLGTFGHIGSFSFSIPKIISTGQGGALITNDDDLAEKLCYLKDFGRKSGGTHNYVYFGINSKFTDIQAVIGIEQMKKLPDRIKRKKEMWALYHKYLKDCPNIKMLEPNDSGWLPWIIDIYVKDREKLIAYLKENNIDTRIQYPVIKEDEALYPISCEYSCNGVWLPSYTEITDTEISEICKIICSFYQNSL